MDKQYIKNGDSYHFDTGCYKWKGNEKVPITISLTEKEYLTADYWLKKLPEISISGYTLKFRDISEYWSSLKWCPFEFTLDFVFNYRHVFNSENPEADYSYDPLGKRYVGEGVSIDTVKEHYYPTCFNICKWNNYDAFCCRETIEKIGDSEILKHTRSLFIPSTFNGKNGFKMRSKRETCFDHGIIDMIIPDATFVNLIYMQNFGSEYHKQFTPNKDTPLSGEKGKFGYPHISYYDTQEMAKEIPLKIENGKITEFFMNNPLSLPESGVFIETDGTSMEYTRICTVHLRVYNQLAQDRKPTYIKSLGIYIHASSLNYGSVIITDKNGWLMDRFFLYGNPIKYSISNPERYIFLVASHINDIRRVETMTRALNSIALNRPDYIYVSYSVEPEFLKCTFLFENAWKNALEDIPHLFLFQPTKKYQFEHYDILKDYVLDNDIVSFSDDDDLTHPDKVKILRENFRNAPTNPDIYGFIHKMEQFGGPEPFSEKIPDEQYLSITRKVDRNRHMCISLKGWAFKDWFIDNYYYTQGYSESNEGSEGAEGSESNESVPNKNRTFSGLLKNCKNLTDIIFYFSLEKHHLIEIPNVLYYHRFKICGL